MNNLERLEGELRIAMDKVNEINSELVRNHACLATKELNRAYSALAEASQRIHRCRPTRSEMPAVLQPEI